MSKRLQIAPAFLDSIRESAKRAHPNECCGLLEGIVKHHGWRATAIHEARNVAADREKNFLIDPTVYIRVMRETRGTGREIIGCFHSHLSGLPEPSDTDRGEAVDDNFVWLIVRGDEVGAHMFDAATRSFLPVEIV